MHFAGPALRLIPLALLPLASIAQAQDECTTAAALTLGVATPFDTTAATVSMPGFSCSGLGGTSFSRDVWFEFTAPTGGEYHATTCGLAGYDSKVEVYSGTCGALVSEGCNDDACVLQAFVVFSAAAGTQYFVRVGGVSEAAFGPGSIRVYPAPDNEDCAGAVALQSGVPEPFDNTDALGSNTGSSCAVVGWKDLWYSVTPTAAGDVTLRADPISNPSLDFAINVFGGTCAGLVEVACVNGTFVTPTEVTFPGTAGTTYFVQLSTLAFGSGQGVINADFAAGPTSIGTPVCAGEANSTGVGAALSLLGSDVAADNDLHVVVEDLPANSLGYAVHSMETNLVVNAGGAVGNLCIASFTMGRFAGSVLDSGASGEVTFQPDLTALPTPTGTEPALAGETRYFQYWYRDTSMGGGSISNFSSAEGLVFN